MLTAAIVVTGSAALLLIGYAACWLVIDARDRKREAEMADRWIAHHRAQVQSNRYLRDDESRPE